MPRPPLGGRAVSPEPRALNVHPRGVPFQYLACSVTRSRPSVGRECCAAEAEAGEAEPRRTSARDARELDRKPAPRAVTGEPSSRLRWRGVRLLTRLFSGAELAVGTSRAERCHLK